MSISESRRRFLKYLALLSASCATPASVISATLSQQRRIIPSSGESIPAIGLGTWLTFGIDLQDEEALNIREQLLRTFLARGGGVLDSSPMYGTSQAVIGECLARIQNYPGLFAASKVWIVGESHGVIQMEQSRLSWKIPRFDLMQVHNLLDWKTHLPVLQEMKARGKLRYVGVTTSHGRRHEELLHIMKTQQLDFVQFTYNMIDRDVERHLLPMAADKGIAVIINRPFQRGSLFDYVHNQPLPGWAQELECTSWAQIFLKFIISHPAVTCVIPATTRLDHLEENINAGFGILPDSSMREQMLRTFNSI